MRIAKWLWRFPILLSRKTQNFWESLPIILVLMDNVFTMKRTRQRKENLIVLLTKKCPSVSVIYKNTHFLLMLQEGFNCSCARLSSTCQNRLQPEGKVKFWNTLISLRSKKKKYKAQSLKASVQIGSLG